MYALRTIKNEKAYTTSINCREYTVVSIPFNRSIHLVVIFIFYATVQGVQIRHVIDHMWVNYLQLKEKKMTTVIVFKQIRLTIILLLSVSR